jgi:hypothetical protein
MRTFVRYAIAVSLAAAAASTVGCASRTTDPVGTVGVNLEIAPGVTISSIPWTITNTATDFSESGTVNVQSSNTATFQVGGLPSGDGYAIALTASSTDGSLTCTGSATFAITPNMTADVQVTLYCSPATPDAGAAAITATTQVCASIDSLVASPTETSLGGTVSLSATASAGSAAASYAWTASAGSFSNPASASTVFTCPTTAGPVTVTLTVSPGAAGCTTNTTESVTVTCDALDPTFTNVYANIISQRCISCHQPGKGGVVTGMLDMSTFGKAYADLVGVPAAGVGAGASGVMCASLGTPADGGAALLRVAPGDAADSLIYEKVSSKLAGTNPPCGSAMPLGGAALTQPQVDLIGAWIAGGALDN